MRQKEQATTTEAMNSRCIELAVIPPRVCASESCVSSDPENSDHRDRCRTFSTCVAVFFFCQLFYFSENSDHSKRLLVSPLIYALLVLSASCLLFHCEGPGRACLCCCLFTWQHWVMLPHAVN
jgi:hypothetical protein